MDKKTLLAVVLSVAVISVGFIIQNAIFTPKDEDISAVSQQTAEGGQAVEEEGAVQTQQEEVEKTIRSSYDPSEVVPIEDSGTEREIKMETDIFLITFSTKGGVITSLKLKEHMDGNDLVEMIYRGETTSGAFNIHFGGPDVAPVDAIFRYRKIGTDTIEFSRDFRAPSENGGTGDIFTLIKTYTFKPQDYLFELEVTIENSIKEYPALSFDGFAYTLDFGPQIGPSFTKLDGRREYRQYQTYNGEKRIKERMPRDGLITIDYDVRWAAIVGKYFALIGIPDATDYEIEFRSGPIPGLEESSRMYFRRPLLKSSKATDVFRFYAGPKQPRVLNKYGSVDKNGFGVKDLHLDEVVDSGRLLGWLESILKAILVMFYRLIPNYGVAIILLTIVIKIVLFPFTHKSYESTAKMQELNPKIQEIREKFKNNPQKMNQEMAALYKREGASPLGGCLPLLLQMPVFFALYGLLNKHFDLRGAMFIPGWITDLSAPESVWNFAPFKLPIVGWSDLRLLPILFVGTQLLSSKMMQTPSATQSQGQMKMMTYLMPIMFFFILYEAPSGLLLYWTVTNALTAVQQKYIAPALQRRKEKRSK